MSTHVPKNHMLSSKPEQVADKFEKEIRETERAVKRVIRRRKEDLKSEEEKFG